LAWNNEEVKNFVFISQLLKKGRFWSEVCQKTGIKKRHIIGNNCVWLIGVKASAYKADVLVFGPLVCL
jgi:hypothetical protein